MSIAIYNVKYLKKKKKHVYLATGRAQRHTPITPWTSRTTTTAPCPTRRSLACPCLTQRTCRQGLRVSSAAGRMGRLAQAPHTGTGCLQSVPTALWCAGAEVRPEIRCSARGSCMYISVYMNILNFFVIIVILLLLLL